MRSPFPGSGRQRARALRTVLALLIAGLSVTSWSTLPAQDETPAEGRERRGGQVIALKVGTIHPVSGPAIENGVVLIRGNRIAAVGKVGEVEIPADAIIEEHPEAHAYPGLVDALSNAFDTTDPGGVDAGSDIAEGLDGFDDRSRELVRHGITTAYVAVRQGGPWRGKGALIRPGTDGFRPFRGARDVALHMLLSSGAPNQHPLQRLAALENVGKEFEQLEKYEEQFEEYAKKKKEYDEAYEKYLAWHRERSGKQEEGEKAEGGAPAEGQPAGEAPAEGGARRGGRRGQRPPGDGPKPDDPKPEEPKPAPTPAQDPEKKPDGEAKPAGDKPEGEKKDEAPKKPTFPKEPERDPAKDALIRVRDGELALFVEAHRVEEIRRALDMAAERKLARLVFEGATGAAAVVDALRDAGCAVIVRSAAPPGDDSPFVDGELADVSPAAALVAAGVPVALGSGDVRRARHLTAVAAEAVGQGLDADAAVRAITLDAARVLNIADTVGSLDAGKLADVVITSAPLLSSRSRVLRVISGGRTVHSAVDGPQPTDGQNAADREGRR